MNLAAGANSSNYALDFEQIVCERVKVYIGIQIKLASTYLLGPTAENFVKTLVKCYKALLGLIRLVSNARTLRIDDLGWVAHA